MRNLPFDRPGRFWRGNLHTHSDRSDGAMPPDQICRHYQEAGYDFVAITDHFRAEYAYPLTDTRALRTSTFTTLLGAELHAPRTGFSAEWHIIAAGLPLGFTPPDAVESGPELARRAWAAGAFIGLAHPAASLLTLADAENLDAAHAVEVYNALSAWEDRGDSWHLCDLLKAGHYYSSTGPEIHAILLQDDRITVRCSPASRILITGCVPGKRIQAGDALSECSLPLDMFQASAYIRVTVIDASGAWAWSNPIWRR